jgi:hypothetical protein
MLKVLTPNALLRSGTVLRSIDCTCRSRRFAAFKVFRTGTRTWPRCSKIPTVLQAPVVVRRCSLPQLMQLLIRHASGFSVHGDDILLCGPSLDQGVQGGCKVDGIVHINCSSSRVRRRHTQRQPAAASASPIPSPPTGTPQTLSNAPHGAVECLIA